MIPNALTYTRISMQSGIRRAMQYVGLPESPNNTQTVNQQAYEYLQQRFGSRLKYILFTSIMALFMVYIVLIDVEEQAYAYQRDQYLAKHTHKIEQQNNTPSYIINQIRKNGTANGTDASHDSTSNGMGATSLWLSLLLSFISWVAIIQVLRHIRYSNTNSSAFNRMRLAQREQMMLSQFVQLSRNGTIPSAIASRLRMLLLQRDFTGDDYEMLQQLDDARFGGGAVADRGASDETIRNLPTHVLTSRDVQSGGQGDEEQGQGAGSRSRSVIRDHDQHHSNNNNNEPDSADEHPLGRCNVCLAGYSLGEEVKTLPCLHKFHKDCLDPWLRLNAVCPICKLQIQ